MTGPLVLAATDGDLPRPFVVLFPATPSPEREIYGLIRSAIADTLREHHQRAEERTAQAVSPSLVASLKDARPPRGIISLGRAAYRVADDANSGIPWIAGALQVQDDDAHGPHSPTAAVSLAPDPRNLLGGLKQLIPTVNRVFVAYNPAANESYIESARAACRALNMTLVALPAHDLREASARYYAILKDPSPHQTDALWILEGNGLVDVEGTLPSMIERAWAQRFVILSNVAEHARRGVLLSAYPDPSSIGRKLASLALEAAAGRDVDRQQYGTDLVFLMNRKVALHLALDVGALTRKHHVVLVGEQ
jgi:putative tryptophan/tyrosine transport system substrate-binding protein